MRAAAEQRVAQVVTWEMWKNSTQNTVKIAGSQCVRSASCPVRVCAKMRGGRNANGNKTVDNRVNERMRRELLNKRCELVTNGGEQVTTQ